METLQHPEQLEQKNTELYLADTVEQALQTALSLNPKAIGFDAEGILIPFIGNEDNTIDDLQASQAVAGIFEMIKRYMDDEKYSDVRFGIMTNNKNPSVHDGTGLVGVIEKLAKDYGIDHFVYSGQEQEDGSKLGKKPSGEQGTKLAELLNVAPQDMVLIDDQGWKNSGEAVRAGLKAIVAPKPIGERNGFGRIIEHRGVMASRYLEWFVFRSLESRQRGRKARFARFAFDKVADVDIDYIDGPFYPE